MPRQSDTRERIIELALPLLQRRGFNGFSYRHLSEALGIKTAAVHYHFRSKADLGIALAADLRRGFQKWAAEIDARLASPRERLDAFFEMHTRFLHDEVASPFGVLEAEYGSLPDGMRQEVRSLASEIHGWVARTLRQGLDAGELLFSGDADDQAIVLGATVQGALHLARAFGPGHYHAAITQLKRLIEPSA
jgi:TetR/AcrR family transcriptional repressor of nem operon